MASCPTGEKDAQSSHLLSGGRSKRVYLVPGVAAHRRQLHRLGRPGIPGCGRERTGAKSAPSAASTVPGLLVVTQGLAAVRVTSTVPWRSWWSCQLPRNCRLSLTSKYEASA
jgi:hypothetical protein